MIVLLVQGVLRLGIENLSSFNRYPVSRRSSVLFMTSTHSRVVQVLASTSNCSRLRREMESYLFGLRGATGFFRVCWECECTDA